MLESLAKDVIEYLEGREAAVKALATGKMVDFERMEAASRRQGDRLKGVCHSILRPPAAGLYTEVTE